MIILTAGHTGPNSGAQCAETHFDEGAENIWLRNRIAEILTNRYGLVVLVDEDRATLKLLVKELKSPTNGTDNRPLSPMGIAFCDFLVARHNERAPSALSPASVPPNSGGQLYRPTDFVIDIHFNAHSNPQARGTETIVSDDATTLELQFASRLAHVTADALDIPLRSIKSESETPHRRLGMLHLTPQSIILEVCFCTSPEDVEAYRKNREKLAADLAWAIYELL